MIDKSRVCLGVSWEDVSSRESNRAGLQSKSSTLHLRLPSKPPIQGKQSGEAEF